MFNMSENVLNSKIVLHEDRESLFILSPVVELLFL
jgi:hypothetical protein